MLDAYGRAEGGGISCFFGGKRYVLSEDLKVCKDSECLSCRGSLFQVVGAWNENERLP